MNLAEMRTALRTELRDTATLWTDAELNRAVVKAVADVDRFFPLESCHEITFEYEVKDETWVAAASPGTWITLANKPIAYNSETVKNSAGTECQRDTDYYIDYINGKITHISGGKIANGESCTISYDKSRVAVDLSSLNIIRIQRVEYPYGNIPQKFASYDFFDNKLWLTGIETEAQSKMIEGKHIIVFYLTQNTVPTDTADGSFPRHLDEVVVKGAAAYACLIKALQYEHQAATDFASARATLGKVEDPYLTSTTTDPSVRKYLTDGDAYLNAVTVGDRVPENYAIYAQRSADIAMALIREATEYTSIATQNLALAERFRNEGNVRHQEFWSILSERAELRGRKVASASPRQIRT